MDCCTRLVKLILCLFNFFCLITGCVILTLGLWIVADKNNFLRITKLDSIIKENQNALQVLDEFSHPTVLDHTAYILVAIGSFIFIIAFLGYCGTLQESKFLLTSYGLFLIIVFILQICGIILCVLYNKKADILIRTGLRRSLTDTYTTRNNRDPVTLSWDLVMSNMQCCGLNNYTDFLDANKFNAVIIQEASGQKVPEACCILQGDKSLLIPADENCIVSPSTANSYLFTGCYKKFVDLINANLNVVFGVLVGLGTLQFSAIVFAFCVCKSIGSHVEQEFHHYRHKHY